MLYADHDLSPLPDARRPSPPLPAQAYLDETLFAREQDVIFRQSWLIACHENDVPDPGDYLAFQVEGDPVVVVRGHDGEVRAFLNVCRHRAARIFEGQGTCPGRIVCPYHGWTYDLDGSLIGIAAREQQFPGVDPANYGLHRISLEVLHGFVFVRVSPDGPTLAEDWAPFDDDLRAFRWAEMHPIQPITNEIWQCNWKVAWDNFLESYHVPIGHPGLNRLMDGNRWEGRTLMNGVGLGFGPLREGRSPVLSERVYQELHDRNAERFPERLRGKWGYAHMNPNLGFGIYPEMIDFFQVLPLGLDRSLIRYGVYGLPDDSREVRVMRKLNVRINSLVNAEDRDLCLRVQQGLRTAGYAPGPLASGEIGVSQFHDYIRARLPEVDQLAPARARPVAVGAAE